MQETVILYRTYERALAARKAQARAGQPTLGVSPTTAAAYLADSWDVWGDGRHLVGWQERLLLMHDVLAESPLLHTMGMARALARFVRWHAGREPLRRAVEGAAADSLTASEQDALAVLRAYLARLEERNLAEPEEAAWLLAGLMPAPAKVQLADELFAPPGTQAWLSRMAGAPVAAGACALPPLPAGVDPGFSFPAGPTAVAAAVRDEVMAALADARAQGAAAPAVAVCAPDAPTLFDGLAPSLLAEGARCALKASVPFGETLVGRALAAVEGLSQGGGSWRQQGTDFAYSPLAAMPPFEAQRLNAQWRGDRLLDSSQGIEHLRELSPTFGLFEAVVAEGTPQAVERLAAAIAERGLLPADAAARERAALQALARLADSAAAVGVKAPVGVFTAELSVPVSVEAGPPAMQAAQMGSGVAEGCPGAGDAASAVSAGALGAAVCFYDLRDLGALAPGSFHAVIVTDMTDAAFSGSRSRSALDGLAEKLGMAGEPSRFAELRAAFVCAERAATARFTVMAPLRDGDQESYPAFLFDEFVATLPDGASADDDDLFALPPALAQHAARRGEEGLAAGLGQAFCTPQAFEPLPLPQRGHLATLPLSSFMAHAQEGGRSLPVLSASAIEAYLQCPYSWFIGRKVRIDGLDEGFGPVEKGTFAHGVYASLFEALAAEGIRRIDDAALPRALALLDEAFDARAAAQPTASPGDRLVPATGLERQELAALRDQLRASLRQMTALPASFSVRAHEYELRAEDGIDYAGARLCGRVDRIDVDEQAGRFAVLDYKGSLADHDAGLPDDADLDALELPHKVQALVYAQALRSALDGMACVGALYLSYRTKDAARLAAGSFSPLQYDAAAVASKKSQVPVSFERFLDAVEQAIAPAVQAMEGGAIAPDPAPGACCWCPVPYCERRC